MWDQQDLAERDIPTDPNSGEQGARMKIEGTVTSQLTSLTFGKSTSDSVTFGQRPVKAQRTKKKRAQLVTLHRLYNY